MEITAIAGADDLARLAELRWGVPPKPAAQLQQAGISGHLVAVRDGEVVGRCSVWATGVGSLGGRLTGAIGHYEASCRRAGPALLEAASVGLREAGCQVAVAPLDGSTWRSYRLVSEPGERPPFFLEPDTPAEYLADVAAVGFRPVARYSSAVVGDLSRREPRALEALQRFLDSGGRLRPLEAGRFAEELRAIHQLSLLAFADNLLYTPLDWPSFEALYAPIRAHLVPELVLLAERDQQLVGFAFAIPDLAAARRGERPSAAILKSMAVHPDHAGQGLGGMLMDQAQQAARQAGFREVIHALMIETNRSRRLSAHYATTCRRYTLFGRALDGGELPVDESAR